MSRGVLTPRVDAPINWVDPVNWLHPLNRDLRGWWVAVPGATGGRTLQDLCKVSHGFLTSTGGSPPSWTFSNLRAGGNAALTFPSTSTERVECGANRRLEIQSHTFTAWIKPTDYVALRLLGGRSNSILAGGYEWAIGGAGSNNGRLLWAYYDGGIRGFFASTTALTAGAWSHVAIVARVPQGAVDFYINGAFVNTVSTAVTAAIVHLPGDTFDIGHATTGTAFLGDMDDIRVSGCVMTATEIRRCYELSRQFYPGMINRVRLPMTFMEQAAPTSNRRRRLICGASA